MEEQEKVETILEKRTKRNEQLKEVIIKRMVNLSCVRDGLGKMTKYMTDMGFFECPASMKFHNNFEGGLMQHCYGLYCLLSKHLDMIEKRTGKRPISDNEAFLLAMMHDFCKLKNYIKTEKGTYIISKERPLLHATESIKRIEQFITLTQQEREIIQFHMGFYGCNEFLGKEKGEYFLRELVATYNRNKLAKLFYFCDDMHAQFFEG